MVPTKGRKDSVGAFFEAPFHASKGEYTTPVSASGMLAFERQVVQLRVFLRACSLM